jgi:hypothetical protein
MRLRRSKQDFCVNYLEKNSIWELESKETVRTADSSHLERRGDTIYNVTQSGVHYVKMTFRRDPERKNFADLKSLEDQYYSTTIPSPPGITHPKRFGCLFSILIGISFFFGISGIITAISNSYEPTLMITGLVMGIVFVVPGVLITLKRVKSYPKRLQPWEEACASYEKERSEAQKKRSGLLEQARSLV